MKSGRDIYKELSAGNVAEGLKRIRALNGRQLDALIHYVEGLSEVDDYPAEVMGAALLEAAGRYLEKVRRKAAKRLRRARKIL